MSRNGSREDRLEQLAAMLPGQSHVRLGAVAAKLGVSEMTVRRDVMESDGRFVCLGGHVIDSRNGTEEGYVLEKETDQHGAAKQAACAKAVRLIGDDDTIFIDCGTTMPHLAAMIPPELELTAVCYSLNVADILSRRPRTRLILLGGLFHPAAASFSGEAALAELNRININKAFISAAGIHEERGVTCFHFHEVPVKRTAMDRAVEAHLVADSSKFGLVRPARFGNLADFTSIVSDRD